MKCYDHKLAKRVLNDVTHNFFLEVESYIVPERDSLCYLLEYGAYSKADIIDAVINLEAQGLFDDDKDELKTNQFENAHQLLCEWQFDHFSTSFASQFFTLFGKADVGNKKRLTMGFPELAGAYMEWVNAKSTDEFYKKYDKGIKS